MRPARPSKRRRGSTLPIVALLIVGLCGFTALSVEVATIATVKVQCQNAADTSAMAGARTLNGSAGNNVTGSQVMSLSAATSNKALGLNSTGSVGMVNFSSPEITYTAGTYHYNNASQVFYPAYTLQSGENYNLVQATASRAVRNAFLSVDAGTGNAYANVTVTASAVAAHRPRDVAIVLDFSGSMNNESDLWNCESYLGPYVGLSNNADPIVPSFGQYSSSTAAMVSTSTYPGGVCNITASTDGMPAEVSSYYSTTATTTPSVSAFTAATSSYASQPQGDVPVFVNNAGSGSYAQNANQIFGTSYTTSIPKLSAADLFENGSIPTASQGSNNFPAAGYTDLYTLKIPTLPSGANQLGVKGFSGYTTGPAYYGKTFFQWPPDPRPTKDWRQLYFLTSAGGPVVNNTTLFNSSGAWLLPYSGGTNFQINYKAILNWIQNVGPNPFPSTLISGGITFYSYIPTDVPASAYDNSQPNSNISDPSQRFWKEYIDFTLGCWRDPFGNSQTPGNPSCSLGPDFAWGTAQISAQPTGTPPVGSKLAYMNYGDNPQRPRHRMWFGPMTMLQFIADTGICSGTLRDISTFSAKLGIASVLEDIQINHPNDLVSLILYNRPQYSNEPSIGNFSQAFYGLNRNYSAMTNSLWYPPNYGTTITPWDVNGSQTPGAFGDYTSNTTTQHGLMLTYNQFSSSSAVSSSGGGGLGRVGAKKLVILETDGMANNNDNAGFTSNGANSYYDILPGMNYQAAGYDQNGTLQVVQAICNTVAGVPGTANSAVTNPGYPGFATTATPVVVQTIAFGIVFEIATATQTNAVGLLQSISQIGGTTFPSSSTDPTNGYKWCIGSLSQRVTLLQQAFSNVMEDGNAVSLIQ